MFTTAIATFCLDPLGGPPAAPEVGFALGLPGAMSSHLLVDPKLLERACPASPRGDEGDLEE